MSNLTLTVNGKNYTGFKEVAVVRSIQQAAHQFELKAAPALDAAQGVFDIEDGALCEIRIDDELVMTGYVDDVITDYDAKTHEVTVIGRSKAADLVDCSTTGKQIKKGDTLAGVAKALCSDFGIQVSIDSSAFSAANKAFSGADLSLDAGQSIFEFLEELARMRAVLLVSDAAGNLVITRAGNARSGTNLELGKNIKAAQGSRSSRSLFSEYQVAGQQSIWATSDTEANSQPLAKVKGDSKRHRPFVIHNDSPADVEQCQARAQHQQRVNYGRSRSIQYTLQGWTQTQGGQLWMPNQLINITDQYNKLNNAERLITEVKTQLSTRSGRTTMLTVMPKSAFDLLEKQEKSGGIFG